MIYPIQNAVYVFYNNLLSSVKTRIAKYLFFYNQSFVLCLFRELNNEHKAIYDIALIVSYPVGAGTYTLYRHSSVRSLSVRGFL